MDKTIKIDAASDTLPIKQEVQEVVSVPSKQVSTFPSIPHKHKQDTT